MHKRIAAPSSLQEAHANLFSVLKRVECKLSALDENTGLSSEMALSARSQKNSARKRGQSSVPDL